MGSVHFIVRSGNCDAEGVELLVSRDSVASRGLPKFTRRLWILLSLFAMGLLGSVFCIWMKFNVQTVADAAAGLGLRNLAGSLGGLVQSYALPIILVLMLVTFYAALKLYRRYVKVNNPKRFRKTRTKV